MNLEFNKLGVLRGKLKASYLKNPAFYKLVSIFRGSDLDKIFATPKTDICLEAYPSSANSYSVNVLKAVNPKLKISSHSHSIIGIQRSLDLKIPTVIIIRHPETVISSRLARTKGDINIFFERYISLYEFVQKNKHRALILTFEQIINNPSKIISDIKSKFNIELPIENFASDKEINDFVFQKMNKYFEDKNQKVTVLPTAEKEQLKKKVREKVITYPGYKKALALYNDIATV